MLQTTKPHFIHGGSQVVWMQQEHLTPGCQVTMLCVVYGTGSLLTHNVFTPKAIFLLFQRVASDLGTPSSKGQSSHWNPEPLAPGGSRLSCPNCLLHSVTHKHAHQGSPFLAPIPDNCPLLLPL